MHERLISRRQLEWLLEVMAVLPDLIDRVERTDGAGGSSEHELGTRTLPDGRRVRIALVVRTTGHGERDASPGLRPPASGGRDHGSSPTCRALRVIGARPDRFLPADTGAGQGRARA